MYFCVKLGACAVLFGFKPLIIANQHIELHNDALALIYDGFSFAKRKSCFQESLKNIRI